MFVQIKSHDLRSNIDHLMKNHITWCQTQSHDDKSHDLRLKRQLRDEKSHDLRSNINHIPNHITCHINVNNMMTNISFK